MEKKLGHIHFSNANSRETYYTMHNVKEAHKYGKGKGIKVGIIDWCFGLEKYPDLYSGGVDVADNLSCLNDDVHHGYWMACALLYMTAIYMPITSRILAKLLNLYSCGNKYDVFPYNNRETQLSASPCLIFIFFAKLILILLLFF